MSRLILNLFQQTNRLFLAALKSTDDLGLPRIDRNSFFDAGSHHGRGRPAALNAIGHGCADQRRLAAHRLTKLRLAHADIGHPGIHRNFVIVAALQNALGRFTQFHTGSAGRAHFRPQGTGLGTKSLQILRKSPCGKSKNAK